MFEACMTYEVGPLETQDFPESDEPVWILGRRYNTTRTTELAELKSVISSKLWFTYRKNFVPIGETGITSDKGWGCMLRCGQMVLAQALTILHLGPDWRWAPSKTNHNEIYRRLLALFEDRRSAPFSIHQIALMGVSEGKAVGDWFGPNTVAQAIKKLATYDVWSNIEVHVALDNTLITKDIESKCSRPQGWKPLLLFVPLRLGLSEINPIYIEPIKACFQLPHCVGIIGGKPTHALYFVGYMGDELVFLDPHVTQPYQDLEESKSDPSIDATYHCNYAGRLPIKSLDPSIALGFFCRTEADFRSLCEAFEKQVLIEGRPLFEMCLERPPEWHEQDLESFQVASVSTAGEEEGEEFEIIG